MSFNPKSDMHFYNCENTRYKNHLKASLDAVESLLTNKQKRSLINHKLQFKRDNFEINQYIQSACELSVISRMYVDFPEGFEYEPKRNIEDELHKNKDVDFSFKYEFLSVNTEVKCFNRKDNKNVNPDIDQENTSTKSRFLPLKDFFVKSKEKFGIQGEFEANILFVCCYDLDDFIDVSNSLAGKSGVCFRKNNPDLMEECILDVEDFRKIDAVIVSNVAFHHERFNRNNEGAFLNPWDYCNTFTMGFQVHNKSEKIFEQTISQLVKQAFNIQNDRYTAFCEKEGLDKFDFEDSLIKFVDHMNHELDGYYFIDENKS